MLKIICLKVPIWGTDFRVRARVGANLLARTLTLNLVLDL